MRKLIVAGVIALAAVGGGALYISQSGPDAAACEKAVLKQVRAGIVDGGKSTEPKECKGLSDDQKTKIGEKVLGETVGDVFAP